MSFKSFWYIICCIIVGIWMFLFVGDIGILAWHAVMPTADCWLTKNQIVGMVLFAFPSLLAGFAITSFIQF